MKSDWSPQMWIALAIIRGDFESDSFERAVIYYWNHDEELKITSTMKMASTG